MRKVILALAATTVALAATPALANEARVEARGGVVWAGGSSQDVWGAAVGYDVDLGNTAFVGAEVSGDKIGSSGTKVAWGFNGRLGAKVADKVKLFAAGGYTTEFCSSCGGAWDAGAGAEFSVGKNVYLKAEYRRYFVDGGTDLNAVVGGVGVRF